MDKVDMNIN